MRIFSKFSQAITLAGDRLRELGFWTHPNYWQSTDVSDKPEAMMRECLNHDFGVVLRHEELDRWAKDIKPNLPWADEHFLERVGGQPLNPGEQWRNWPWSNSADKFRKAEQFSHSYMERYWPKIAGSTLGGITQLPAGETIYFTPNLIDRVREYPLKGVRYAYGDLSDVISLLARDPLTRQAFLPVWFPEDTGVNHGERVPCTLGYQFIQRNGFLHINYYIRSCDYYRHFRDDIYLSVRLALWVLDRLREKDEKWKKVSPGIFSMYITSLHVFVNDCRALHWDIKP